MLGVSSGFSISPPSPVLDLCDETARADEEGSDQQIVEDVALVVCMYVSVACLCVYVAYHMFSSYE